MLKPVLALVDLSTFTFCYWPRNTATNAILLFCGPLISQAFSFTHALTVNSARHVQAYCTLTSLFIVLSGHRVCDCAMHLPSSVQYASILRKNLQQATCQLQQWFCSSAFSNYVKLLKVYVIVSWSKFSINYSYNYNCTRTKSNNYNYNYNYMKIRN